MRNKSGRFIRGYSGNTYTTVGVTYSECLDSKKMIKEKMKEKLKLLALYAFSASALTACGESNDTPYQRGLSDGYAVGYNTTCKIRATLIAGVWDNAHYSRGYADGNAAGVAACNRK